MLSSFTFYLFHLDLYLETVISQYGAITYFFLFSIIFLESGILLTPFLPGESLLFTCGLLASQGLLSLNLLLLVLTSAAVIGGFVNYWIGFFFGKKLINLPIKNLPRYLTQTQLFYEKYGLKTILIARFVPIVRTFAPFVAGLIQMNKLYFACVNIIGGILWIAGFLEISYHFGNISLIKNNLIWVILCIIIISLVPIVIEWYRHKIAKNKVSI